MAKQLINGEWITLRSKPTDAERQIKNAINSVKFALEASKDGVLRMTLKEAEQALYLALGMVIRDGCK